MTPLPDLGRYDDTVPGQFKLQVGDLLRCHGGVLVTKVTESNATVRRLEKKKHTVTDRVTGESAEFSSWQRDFQISNWLDEALLERRGGPEAVRKLMHAKNMLTLELGDSVCVGGQWRIAVAITERTAVLAHLASGNELRLVREARVVNEYYFEKDRKAEAGRLARLNDFARLAGKSLEELKQALQEEDGKSQESNTMAKKAKQTVAAKKSAAKKKPKTTNIGRPRATDEEVKDMVKATISANEDASNQSIVDALRAANLGCSVARLEAIRKAN